ncbi:MAG: hypothetical protein ACI4LP_10100 [Anaerovoracaceae bacterium]
MILTYERAAGGEIAAGKGSAQWTPEGKPNAGILRSVGATEKILRYQNRHMTVCAEWV